MAKASKRAALFNAAKVAHEKWQATMRDLEQHASDCPGQLEGARYAERIAALKEEEPPQPIEIAASTISQVETPEVYSELMNVLQDVFDGKPSNYALDLGNISGDVLKLFDRMNERGKYAFLINGGTASNRNRSIRNLCNSWVAHRIQEVLEEVRLLKARNVELDAENAELRQIVDSNNGNKIPAKSRVSPFSRPPASNNSSPNHSMPRASLLSAAVAKTPRKSTGRSMGATDDLNQAMRGFSIGGTNHTCTFNVGVTPQKSHVAEEDEDVDLR